MQRYAQVIGIRPEAMEEYYRYHQAVWPAVLEMIVQCNIRNYSIYRYNELLFAYFEYHGTDYEADMKKMAADPETQRWWSIMIPMQKQVPEVEPGEHWHRLEEQFHFEG